jgi:biopolymer transport protein TolR
MAGHSNGSQEGMIVGINVTPLVDITLVLLIIFIVTAKMVVTPAVPLDLPKASRTEQVQMVFSVIITQQGSVLVNGAPAPHDDALKQASAEALAKDALVRAVIHADGKVPHFKVLHVLDVLKQAGMQHIAFAAHPVDEGDVQ